MLEFARSLIGKKFCADIAEIPSSIDRLNRAIESLDSHLIKLNNTLQRGVSVDITSMPQMKQFENISTVSSESPNLRGKDSEETPDGGGRNICQQK
jgi:hypothetical protein